MIVNKNKKGQGLSLNTIIIAIIVIIVLVIIILITTGQLQKFTQAVDKQSDQVKTDCAAQNGICKSTCGNKETKIENTECSLIGQVCCKPTSSK